MKNTIKTTITPAIFDGPPTIEHVAVLLEKALQEARNQQNAQGTTMLNDDFSKIIAEETGPVIKATKPKKQPNTRAKASNAPIMASQVHGGQKQSIDPNAPPNEATATEERDTQEAEKQFSTSPILATCRNSRNLSPGTDTENQPQADNKPLVLTVITSTKPDRLTKIIGVDTNGKMTKQPAANMARGSARRIHVNDLEDLRTGLATLTSAQAVCWGITKFEEPHLLCTKGDTEAQQLGAVARSRENFGFSTGPGIMMIDHDGLPNVELSQVQCRDRLLASVPALESAPMLGRPSASAGCLRPDGTQLSGLTRHRFYIPVTNAALIPEAGKALTALIWAIPGNGWCDVGKAGQKLPRCLVDTSVWQPERLDFAGPPVLIDGVTRAGVDGVIYGDKAGRFDLSLLIEAANDTVKKQASLELKAAQKAVTDQCEAARDLWVATHAPRLAETRGIKLAQAVSVLKRAAGHQVLMGDFELICHDGQVVTVGELLDTPHRWHNQRFADPLEPGDDRRVAVSQLLNGTRTALFSHAHGGIRFELRRQSARVQLGRGMRIESTDAVLNVLRDRSELFDFGSNSIAYVADGKAAPVTADWLLDHCGRVAEFFSVKIERDEDGTVVKMRETAEDAPTGIVRAVMAKHGGRNFRKLVAVITAPCLRPDGSILDAPGHDTASGLMYVTNEAYPPTVPVSPTPAQALDALALLWSPVRLFPFVDDVSRGVTLAAMIAACLRASLPTCPGTGFDAPAAGTGKSLLAKCVGHLATGSAVSVFSPTKDEEETRKRLFALLRGGAKVILWDNVSEPVGNSVLDAFLTAEVFADRVLQTSDVAELPNRALFMVSGNNMMLTGDTHRRILFARMDADIETPYTREFDWSPLTEVTIHRQSLVVAALTIVRAFITAGRPKSAPGRIASFEQWDDLVRQPVCWIKKIAAESRPDLPTFADPAAAIDLASAQNPETAKLSALLNAWLASFGDTPTTPANAIKAATSALSPNENLLNALEEIAGQHGKLNVRILGRWLEKKSDTLCDGLRLKLGSKAHGLKHWFVSKSKEREKRDETGEKVARVATGCENWGGVETFLREVENTGEAF